MQKLEADWLSIQSFYSIKFMKDIQFNQIATGFVFCFLLPIGARRYPQVWCIVHVNREICFSRSGKTKVRSGHHFSYLVTDKKPNGRTPGKTS